MSFIELVGSLRVDERGPLYFQLQNRLRDAVHSGTIDPRHPLPTERELASLFDVSRITVRNAIAGLIREGILESRRGVGTFVVQRVEKVFSTFSSFTEEMRSRGRRPHNIWLSKNGGAVMPEEALALSLSPGAPVYRFRRVRCADGQRMALEKSTVPAYCLPSPEAVEGSLYEALGSAGCRPARALQRLSAVCLSEEQAEALETKPGAPGLFIERRSFLRNGKVVELTHSVYRGDAYDIVAELNLS